jgi:undecaprenyl-diphosphatase
MLDALLDLDKELFLTLNSWNATWLDGIMMALTNGKYWLPFFLLVLGVIFYKYRWNSVAILLYLVLVIILADQLSASLIKPLVGRLRPSHDPELKDMVHLVNNYRGGLYSFVSSHATNAFGVAIFLFLAVKRNIAWISIMFLWALIFSYTRIYLGVHYPLDIICGGLLGALIAFTVFRIQTKLPEKLRIKS